MKKSGVALVVLVLLALIVGAVCGHNVALRRFEAEIDKLKPQIDTIRDTITNTKPVYVKRYIRDTCYLPADTVRISDSLYIPIPIESRVYEDSTYRAVVSGFRPSLDSISVYRTNTIITRAVPTPVQPRISVGIQAGAGVTISKTPQIAPYIGIGIQYNLINLIYASKKSSRRLPVGADGESLSN